MPTMLDSYQTYFRNLHPILKGMANRGIPIDNARREELRTLINREDAEVTAKIQSIVPAEVLSTKQKNGFKNPPLLECEECHLKTREDHICGVGPADSLFAQQGGELVSYADLAAAHGLVLREVTISGAAEKCRCSTKNRSSCSVCHGTGIIPAGTVEMRWATPVEFNPNSRPQVIRFMKFLHHPVPKSAKKVDANGDPSDTTDVKDLERLYVKTKHPIYPLLIEKRQMTKMLGTYVDGWAPGKDGRIHTTWTFQTATWQLSSRAPNLQNGIKRGRSEGQRARSELFNRMQRAEPGHILVNLDFKSFHAQTTACEAGLPDYLRLAKIDIHSFIACHFLKLPERFDLLKWSDADLKAFLSDLKKDKSRKFHGMIFSDIRSKSKAASLGIGFGMGPRKLYMQYKEDFENQREAESMHGMIMHELFPGLLKWQNSVKARAAEDHQLINRFGAIRHFYDVQRWDRKTQKMVGGDQAEAAIAFLPASNAFGMIRWAMLNLEQTGLCERYELINTIHDSLVLHPLIEEADDAISAYLKIMQAPCPMMVYPGVTGPEGLSVEVEAAKGDCLAEAK